MLVKILLICSSPPNGDNKTLLSAVFISFFCPPPARFPLSGKKKNMQMKDLNSIYLFLLNSSPNRRTDGEGRVGAGGRGRRRDKHFWFVCFSLFPVLKCSDCKGGVGKGRGWV